MQLFPKYLEVIPWCVFVFCFIVCAHYCGAVCFFGCWGINFLHVFVFSFLFDHLNSFCLFATCFFLHSFFLFPYCFLRPLPVDPRSRSHGADWHWLRAQFRGVSREARALRGELGMLVGDGEWRGRGMVWVCIHGGNSQWHLDPRYARLTLFTPSCTIYHPLGRDAGCFNIPNYVEQFMAKLTPVK